MFASLQRFVNKLLWKLMSLFLIWKLHNEDAIKMQANDADGMSFLLVKVMISFFHTN